MFVIFFDERGDRLVTVKYRSLTDLLSMKSYLHTRLQIIESEFAEEFRGLLAAHSGI